jgi:hypothetical protein
MVGGPFQMGLPVTATHILCEYEATAYLTLRHLDHFIQDDYSYHEVLVNKILHFIHGG